MKYVHEWKIVQTAQLLKPRDSLSATNQINTNSDGLKKLIIKIQIDKDKDKDEPV